MPTATWLPLAVLFGSPLVAAAAAGGAVAIPVVIHLLNRRRFRVVTWAAMRFLLAAQRKNSRRMRLEQLVLLAVRCLAALLLVLALASVTPWAEAVWYWANPEGGVAVASGGARRHKVLVVDGSFSMAQHAGEAKGGAPAETCFERARALAARVVRDSGGGDGFSVVLMASPPRRVVPEPSEDARRVAAEVEALRLPHGNADLAATLATVEAILATSPAKYAEREVYFLTDLQQSTWVSRQPAAVAGVLQKIQARARTVFVDVGRDGAANLAVTGLALGDDFAQAGRTATAVVTLHNYGPETLRHVRVSLLVGRARAAAGDPAWDKTVRVVGEQVADEIKPGQQATVAFAPTRPPLFPSPGEYVLQAQLAEGDALDLDDSRAAVVTVKRDVPVMLVNGKPFGDPFDQATRWLQLALNPFEGESAPADAAARVRVVNPTQFADEGQGDLADYDCVFLCDVPAPGAAEVRRLEGLLRRGGGVVFCLGGQVRPGEYNRLLHRGGAGLLPAALLGLEDATAAYDFRLSPEEDAEREPPLRAFQGANDRAALTAARFRRFYRLSEPTTGVKPRKLLGFVASPVAGKENAPEARTPPAGGVAALAWNPPAPADARESRRPGAGDAPPARLRGRVVLLNTTANSDWGNWPASPSYPAFMQEVLRYAAAGRLRERESAVGEPLELFLPSLGGGRDATVRTPDGREEAARSQNLDDASVLRWADTDLSGVYRAALGAEPAEHLFAVNVPSQTADQQGSESDLSRAGREDLRRAYPEWEVQVVRDPAEVTRTAGPSADAPGETTRAAQGPAVARGLLLAMLALLLAEVVLAWAFGHYSAAAGSDAGGARPPFPLPVRVALAVLPAALFVLALGAAGVLVHDAWTGDFLGFLPDATRRGVESWLGVPPPAVGEESHWRLEYTPYLWDRAADAWLAPALAAAAAVLVVAVYRREGQARTSHRAVLVGLRCGLLLLLLAVLLPQLRVFFERQGSPDVVLLIDDSQSMSAADRYRDPGVRAAAERLGRLDGVTEAERLRLAQALVTRSDPDWLTALLTKHRVRLHVYHCSGRAQRLSTVATADDVRGAAEAVRGLRADAANDTSQLGAAVRQVLNDFRGSSLAAVVMLTDGVTTEGEDLAKVSKYAAQSGVPLYFVGLGDAHEARDVVLHDLKVEDTVYVNDRLVFELQLTAQGYPSLKTEVTLAEKSADGGEREIKTEPVSAEGGRPAKVRFVHQPSEPGEKVYVVKTRPQGDEADKENNRLERSVFVREAKPIKVLYVEGYRRYEYHYVKTLLERESAAAKGNKSLDLKVLLLDADPEFAAEDRSALADWPTRAELRAFDVVILGDVDPKPRGDDRIAEHLKDLADFVRGTDRPDDPLRDGGGGLLVVAGERYAPRAFRDTPLKDVLPVEVTAPPGDPDDAPREEAFRPELTPLGRDNPIFRFSPDEKENEEIYARLRPMFWHADGYAPKRAAEVLAVHPSVKVSGPAAPPAGDATGAGAPAVTPYGDRLPLVVQQFAGSGRVLFFGFDESWRWNFREDQQHFNQFWVQTVRYLARSRLGRLELRLDRQTPYRRGEAIKVTVRFPDDAPAPPADTEVKVVAERRPPDRGPAEVRTVSLARVDGSRATYEAVLTRTPEGTWKFWLSQPAATPRPRAECVVQAPPGEMERLRMNQSEMERAAEESHGRFYSLADADRLPDELPAGSRVTVGAPGPPVDLWNHLAVFAAAVLFLTAEWVLRKQSNLL